MGTPMVLRLLLANFDVRVWNRTPEKVEEVVAAGAIPCETAAALAAESDVILLCLANTAAVVAVVHNTTFMSQLCAEKTIIDLSSISPDTTCELASEIQQTTGALWIDAPVSGGVAGAKSGELVIMVGGEDESLKKVYPILAPLSKRITLMGPTGAGQTTKLCNQIIVGCNITAIGEAYRLAREAGVDTALLSDALRGGFADSLPFQIFGRRMANGEEKPVSIKIETMLKDLEGATRSAAARNLDLPLTQAAATLLRERALRGDTERCITSMVDAHTQS